MITKQEILDLAGEWSLGPQVVEKDYVIGWLLAKIYEHPHLASSFVFKGGTCLKKCYFETYRFSEDLDFTVTNGELFYEETLVEAFRDVVARLYEETGIESRPEDLRFEIFENPRGGLSCEGRIYYLGPLRMDRGGRARVKLDLTADELLTNDAVAMPISQPYSDAPLPPRSANCYLYEELFAEKVRALGERARPRDLYDVISIFRRSPQPPNRSEVVEILTRKCAHKGVSVPTLSVLEKRRAEMEADWDNMLRHQLQALPGFSAYWSELPKFFRWLEAREEIPRPSVMPGALKDMPLERDVALPISGNRSILNTIRFAGANRLCVDLDYQGSTRRIEPYSLRRTQEGNVVLHAIRRDSREHRSYRLDRIRAARVSDETFAPTYAIELTPMGLQSVPARARRPSRPSRYRGPQYVYQCYACGRRFPHRRQNSTLGPHKDKYGTRCYGRSGSFVETR